MTRSTIRIRQLATVAAASLVVTACGGGGGRSAALVRPPSPVYLSVYVNNSRVSVSPGSVGAGPVIFQVTNQSDRSQALAIAGAASARTLATTAPISPQGTTQVDVNIDPGQYTIGVAAQGRTEAQRSQSSPIRPASFHIGSSRPNSSNQLLQP